MFWDVALAVLAATAQVVTGFLGWRVTVDGVREERKKIYELLFILASAIGIVAVGSAAYRGSQISRDLADLKQGQQEIKNNPPIVNVPPPIINVPPQRVTIPTKARFLFAFWPIGPDEQLSSVISKSAENGIVTVAITAKNVGDGQADNGQIWMQICDGCKFAEEPEGTTMPPNDPLVRRKRFDKLHMGSYFEGTTLRVIPPTGADHFTIALKYACERCPPIDNKNPQKLRVNLN